MGEFHVRTTRGRRAMFRRMDSGNHYVFYRNATEGKWITINPAGGSDDGHKARALQDLAFFKSDDLFEVKDNTPRPKQVIERPVVEEEVKKPKIRKRKIRRKVI